MSSLTTFTLLKKNNVEIIADNQEMVPSLLDEGFTFLYQARVDTKETFEKMWKAESKYTSHSIYKDSADMNVRDYLKLNSNISRMGYFQRYLLGVCLSGVPYIWYAFMGNIPEAIPITILTTAILGACVGWFNVVSIIGRLMNIGASIGPAVAIVIAAHFIIFGVGMTSVVSGFYVHLMFTAPLILIPTKLGE
ncbi:hypothetical protein [Vibrio chagasii]|uniref:hypothetical protein n=1 Tax=Vibrio chagasii TaxID=170679 RepID=UPI003BB6A1B3